jgi:hypothetical protein
LVTKTEKITRQFTLLKIPQASVPQLKLRRIADREGWFIPAQDEEDSPVAQLPLRVFLKSLEISNSLQQPNLTIGILKEHERIPAFQSSEVSQKEKGIECCTQSFK